MSTDDTHQITVTMLGPSLSGKTTFLLGMYSVLSAGLNNYFLHACDPDQDLDLSEAWDALIDDGLLPPPNEADRLKPYSFVFREHFNPLLSIDWLDYRGGALDDRVRGEDSDTSALIARLDLSDAVYLVLDGRYLRDPVTPHTVRRVQRASKAQRMTYLLQESMRNRRKADQPPPAVVVLVTKADLVAEARSPAERAVIWDQLVEDVTKVLPVCFQQGVTTLVCPVMLGHFGAEETQQVDPQTVRPMGLHKPILFSLLRYLEEIRLGLHQTESDFRQEVSRRELAVANHRPTFWRKGRHLEYVEAVVDARQRVEEVAQMARLALEFHTRVARELRGLPVFKDGVKISDV
ncbi:hypothetical protein [Streptomyces spectabilis]|uniref:Uncharacterized protein n=1 Tax=Streptomyces spectabilis TaxID=68270 RepID=A0A5P2XNN0_STRST|nr:hypothetical protein [Streptomyces spectabilis]MBB5102286.1 hypothetical protein [Streptomyces spectabilis]MCI3907334.1 hypothetical protein [Streptomyces spectabilis]QEV64062.1 hypothetical protein CP982_39650 [Streptomyces spectabilis]GGV29886.1 hypothetical protein GCM10010245_48600 [Streptomyces spectabilis]